MNEQTLGQRIAQLRHQKNLTQEALARELGVSPQAISKWETDTSCPDIMLLPTLAGQLSLTVDELLTGEKPPLTRILSEEERKPLSQLVARQVLTLPNGDRMVSYNSINSILLQMDGDQDTWVLRMGTDENERVYDLRKILRKLDYGMVGKLFELDTPEGIHFELWVD